MAIDKDYSFVTVTKGKRFVAGGKYGHLRYTGYSFSPGMQRFFVFFDPVLGKEHYLTRKEMRML